MKYTGNELGDANCPKNRRAITYSMISRDGGNHCGSKLPWNMRDSSSNFEHQPVRPTTASHRSGPSKKAKVTTNRHAVSESPFGTALRSLSCLVLPSHADGVTAQYFKSRTRRSPPAGEDGINEVYCDSSYLIFSIKVSGGSHRRYIQCLEI